MLRFSQLSVAEAEAFLAEYEASIGERAERFVEGLARAGGPASPEYGSDGWSSGLAELWLWFIEQYDNNEPSGPFAAAGVDTTRVRWVPLPYLVDEVMFFAVGVANWFETILMQEFPDFVRVRVSDVEDAAFNRPLQFLDSRVPGLCSDAIFDQSEWRRRPVALEEVFDSFYKTRERLVAEQAGLLPDAPPPGPPDLHVDDPVFEEGEIGVEYDLVASSAWRDAFEEALQGSPLLERITDLEPGEYLSGVFRGSEEEIRDAVNALWHQSEPKDSS